MTTFARLQSPVAFQLNKNRTQSCHTNQRPKLSLNTSSQLSYGSPSTGLRLDPLSESSPTHQNTYRNAFQIHHDNWPESQASGEPNGKSVQWEEQSAFQLELSLPSNHEAPVGSMGSDLPLAPYNLAKDTRSILINGPISKRTRCSSDSTKLYTQRDSNSKQSHRRQKRVYFRDPISEDISTTRFILKHSDIRSRSTSPASKLTTTSRGRRATLRSASRGSPPPLRSHPPSTDTSNSSTIGKDEDTALSNPTEDDPDDNPIPNTPVTGRHKKEREWVWTLGPLPGHNGPGFASQVDNSSEEDLDQSLGESVSAASAFLS